MLPRPLLACLALASSACSDDAAGRADTTAAPDATAAGDLDDDAPTGPPVPGGDIGWSAPSAGFATTRPDWAEAGTCASGQWWQYSGDHESTHMHPGRACIECHTRESAPAFRFAGTVFADVADADECRGVAGVDVTILRADGAVVADHRPRRQLLLPAGLESPRCRAPARASPSRAARAR
ncbi:MAG: hypothetical protein U1F43_38410 [Myxococcota bacterium]